MNWPSVWKGYWPHRGMGVPRCPGRRPGVGPLRNAEHTTDVTPAGPEPGDPQGEAQGCEVFPEMPLKCGIFTNFRGLVGRCWGFGMPGMQVAI